MRLFSQAVDLAEDDPQYVADSDHGSFPAVSNATAVGDGELVAVGNVERESCIHTRSYGRERDMDLGIMRSQYLL